MLLKPLNKNTISVGNPLAHALYDKSGVLLLRKGYEVRTQDFLNAYLEHELYIRNDNVEEEEVRSPGTIHSFDLIRQVEKALPSLLRQPFDGRLPMAVPCLSEIVQRACQIDKDATLASILLETPSSYAVRHVINVAILSEILMKVMDIPAKERISALAAALTMNIGMFNIQDKLHSQLGSLTIEQQNAIRMHPVIGHKILVQAGVTDPIWLEAVAHHHEQPDGSGYPNGLKQGSIGLASLIIAALDLYCAVIAPRGYRHRLLPIEAMREIFGERGQKFGVEIIDFLIKEVGLYPPGIRVKLANDEMALVIRRGKRAHSPKVVTIEPQPYGQWQLGNQLRDTALSEYAPQEAAFIDESDLKFDWRLLWRKDE